MNLLLDTCALIWCVSEPERLSEEVRRILVDSDTGVYVSAISCAEVACLADDNRIRTKPHWRTWFDRAVSDNGWTSLAIDLEVIQEAFSLPGTFHRDPADRMIVSTARLKRLTIVTTDRKILDYPHVKSMS